MKRVLRLSSVVHMIVLLAGINAYAQVKFTTVTGSKEVGRNEYLRINFIVENATTVDHLTPPSFPGFRVVGGPNQSSGMTVVNGNVSQYEGLSFVLQPVRTGKFTIQGASASIDGHLMHSNPVSITVNATGSGSAGNSSGAGSNPFFQPLPDPFAPAPEEADKDYLLKPGENVREKIHKNLFVKVEINKSTCYVGEPVVATYKLYSRLRSESRVTKRPSLNGFSVYDMVDPNNDVSSVEKVNGKTFTVHIIRKSQLIPLQAGSIDLDPMEVENTVHFLKGSRKSQRSGRGDIFDPFEDDDAVTNWEDENVTLETKPVTITVKPLPETGKPADFTGAVGRFTLQASLGNKNVAARGEASLRVTIQGSGNLPIINAPDVKWPGGLEAFDPVAKEEVDRTTIPMSGSKTFQYVFNPNAPGSYNIPSIDFSYFDPASGTYHTLHTDTLTCKVGPAIKNSSPSSSAASNVSSDEGAAGVFIHKHLEWIFAILILSALAIYLWRQGLRVHKGEEAGKEGASPERDGEKAEKAAQAEPANTDRSGLPGLSGQSFVSGPVLSTAPVVAVDPLSHARILFAEINYKGFYHEINRALWKAIGDKVDLPASSLNKSNMIKKLEQRGWDNASILMLENTFSECEINIYTPVYDTYNMQQVLRQAELLIGKL
ncbi:MAG: BatD family protein [Puia sp.]|nr:BatD family protein [Puia sp.]